MLQGSYPGWSQKTRVWLTGFLWAPLSFFIGKTIWKQPQLSCRKCYLLTLYNAPCRLVYFASGESPGDRNNLLWGKGAATCQRLCQRTAWVPAENSSDPPLRSRSFDPIWIPSVIPGNSNLQITSLSEELARKSDDASRQQEEITHLLSQIVDLQKKVKLVRNHLSLLKLDTRYTFFTINITQQDATYLIFCCVPSMP